MGQSQRGLRRASGLLAVRQNVVWPPRAVDLAGGVCLRHGLAQTIQTYAQTLAAQWQAAVDLAGLMEVEDICQLGTPAIKQLPHVGAARPRNLR